MVYFQKCPKNYVKKMSYKLIVILLYKTTTVWFYKVRFYKIVYQET